MLTIFRRFKRQILGLIVTTFAVVLMVSWGVDSRGNFSRQGQDAITIDGEKYSTAVYRDELARLTDRAREQLKGNFSSFQKFLNLEQRTIDLIIERHLIEKFLGQVGLTAGLEQVTAHIASYPFFQKFGLTQSMYRQFLTSQQLTGDQLEEQARKEIARAQLIALLGDLALPTTPELRAVYTRDNTAYEFSYLKFKAADFTQKVDAKDEAKLQKYYDEHAESYRKPRSVRYNFVKFAPEEFLSSVELSDEDILNLYEEKRGGFFEAKEMQLAQIVIKKIPETPTELENLVAPKPVGAEKVDINAPKREAARKVVERLRAGEDFAKIVPEVSEDEATKTKGGDLGWQQVSAIDKNIRPVADRLEQGKYSDVLETPDSFVVIFATNIKPRRQKEVSEVRDQLVAELKAQDAPEYAAAAAEEFYGKWESKGEMSLADFAKQENRQIFEAGRLMTANEDSPNGAQGLTKLVSTLPQGDRSIQKAANSHFLVEIVEAKDSFIPPLADVRAAVVANFTSSEATVLAKESAAKALQELAAQEKPKSLEELASAFGVEIKTTAALTPKSESADELLSQPEAKQIGFSLHEQKPVATKLVEGGDSFYVVRLKSRKPPEAQAFESQKTAILRSESNAVKSRTMEYLVQNLRAEATIVVSPKLLDRRPDQDETENSATL